MMDLVVLGHILHETVLFPDKTLPSVLGSPAAYSSVAAAKLGAKVGLVTKIGADFPPRLLRVFKDVGVDTSGVIPCRASTKNLLNYDREGNKSLKFLTKADEILPADLPKHFLDSHVVYVCPIDYEVPISTVESLKRAQATLAVDLGGYGGGTSDTHPSRGKGERELRRLVPFFDIVKGSAEDFRHILGVQDFGPDYLVTKLVEWGALVGIITLGANGSILATKDGLITVPAFPLDRTVDCTGAGDTYAAGFLVEFARTHDVERAALYATVTTSFVIERSGGVTEERMPSQEQVECRLNRFHVKSSRPG